MFGVEWGSGRVVIVGIFNLLKPGGFFIACSWAN